MLAWWLYALALGAVACVAAVAMEAGFGARGLPRRFSWVAAMACTAVLPAVAIVLRSRAVSGRPVHAADAVAAAADAPGWAVGVDAMLAGVWMAASVALALVALAQVLWIWRIRARSQAAVVDGVSLRVSRRWGPAVVGLIRPAIVVPEWVLELSPESRRMILLHEQEHRRARDLWLLALGAAAVCLFPWNAALWWQYRRLCDAVELDCDARVLRGTRSPRAYGLVLIEAARRLGQGGWLAAGLGARASLLERRVRALVPPSHGHRWMRMGRAACVIGAAVAMAAVAVRAPERLPAGIQPLFARTADAGDDHLLLPDETRPLAAAVSGIPSRTPVPGQRASGSASPARRVATRDEVRASRRRDGAAISVDDAAAVPAPVGGGGVDGSAQAAAADLPQPSGSADRGDGLVASGPSGIRQARLDPRLRVAPLSAERELLGRFPPPSAGPALGEVAGIDVTLGLRPRRRL